MTLLVPVLGDQLTPTLASLRDVDRATTVVVMAEVRAECTYVKHHKKKIALVLSAMRHFAAALRGCGWTVDYVTFDDPANTHSLKSEVVRAARTHKATAIRMVEAGEYRLLEDQRGWGEAAGLPIEILEDDRFVCTRSAFDRWAKGRASLRMEYFYREMRKRTGVLMMADGLPEGGQWNYDHDNRATPPRGLNYPAPERFAPDAITQDVIDLVAREFPRHFGDLDNFNLPVTRPNALQALDHFIAYSLPDFGRYQDAMIVGQDYLYHSVLSLCLNVGLLEPLEVCRAAEAAYASGSAPINSVEGFIRQIIGWREYMRGMYWRDMPKLAGRNALGAHRSLPEFYWTGETDMRCLSESVGQTKREAYAHHIQRLMVLGNFAAIAGISPQAVSDWYLVVYFDAYEWVEMPNVIGMSQYADGGMIASKPYVSTGAYINRMSDYCRRCRYDVKQRTGPDACPFNALYWDFLARHEERFRGNQRMRNIYSGWDRMAPQDRQAARDQAASFLDELEPEAPGWAR
ncbi:MAG: deoxyribodipyrimidine photolyase [Sphingomonadales bacterium]|nr:deoxyribodipyrimidine photolyase [Sphingomonadales bacterium]